MESEKKTQNETETNERHMRRVNANETFWSIDQDTLTHI